MWFAFGIVTAIAGFAFSWYARVHRRWRGQRSYVGGILVERRIARSRQGQWLDRLGVEVPRGSPFRLRLEGAHDRFFKGIGVASELPLRNREADRSLYLESDDRAVAGWIDGDPELARRLIELCGYSGLGHVVGSIERVDDRLWLNVGGQGDADIELATAALAPPLAEVAAALERIGPRRAGRDGFVRRAALLLSFNTAIAAAGALACTSSVARHDLLEPWRFFLGTLPLSLGAMLVLAFAALRSLGRTSRTHLVLIEIALVGTLGFAALGNGVARHANVEWDEAPPQHVDIEDFEVRSYRCGKRRRSTCYALDLPPRAELRGNRTLRIGSGVYHMLRGAPVVRISIRPGHFGAAWIEAIGTKPAESAAH